MALSSLRRDAAVPRCNECDNALPVRTIFPEVSWQRSDVKTTERDEEVDRGAVLRDQVLKQEKIYVPLKATEKTEEVGVSSQIRTEGTFLTLIMQPDALECEVKSILDFPMEPSRSVDRTLALDLS